jgi:hypothetical protein
MKRLLIILILLEVLFALVAFTPNAYTPILSVFIRSPQNDLDAAGAATSALNRPGITVQEKRDANQAFNVAYNQFLEDMPQWRRMKGISARVSICLLLAVTAVLITIIVRKKNSPRTTQI